MHVQCIHTCWAHLFVYIQADEVKPREYVAIDKYMSQKSYYELGANVGEKFLVYENVTSDEELVKVKSEKHFRVGYLPSEIVYQLQDL